MGVVNIIFFWNQGVLGKKFFFILIIGVVVKVVLIFVVGFVIVKVFRKYLFSFVRIIKYVWIINEDIVLMFYNMVVVVVFVYFFDVFGVFLIIVVGISLSNIFVVFFVFYFFYVFVKKLKDYIIMCFLKQKFLEVQFKVKFYYYIFVMLVFFIVFNIVGLSGRFLMIVVVVGIMGIVFGFVFQMVVVNFILGIFMYFDKLFKIGDFVEVVGYLGVVYDIRIFLMRIRIWDGFFVRILNEKFFNSDIKNFQKYLVR